MNCHQIISGSANDGNFTFSNGNIDGYPFLAYGSGSEIIILDKEFKQIQVLSNQDAGGLNLLCLDCTKDNGKILASYGHVVFVLEPNHVAHEEEITERGLSYTWSYAHKIDLSHGPCGALSWGPSGRTFMAAGHNLQLWALPSAFVPASPLDEHHMDDEPLMAGEELILPPGPRGFFIGSVNDCRIEGTGSKQEAPNGHLLHPCKAESNHTFKSDQWICVWEAKCPSAITQVQFSSDGQFFATISEGDPLVKLWFQTRKVRNERGGENCITGSSTTVFNIRSDPGIQAVIASFSDLDFDFLYLYHPSAVKVFEWRQTSHYMPKGTVASVLLTSCEDKVIRIWREGSNLTGLNEDDNYFDASTQTGTSGESMKMRMHHRKSKVLKHLKHIRQKFQSIELVHGPNGRVMVKKRRGTSHKSAAHHGHLPSLGSLISSQDLGKNWNHFCGPAKGCGAVAAYASTPINAFPRNNSQLAVGVYPPNSIPKFHLVSKLDVGKEFSTYMPIHWLNNKEFHFTLRSERIMFMLGQQINHNSSTLFHDSDSFTQRSGTISDAESQDEIDALHFKTKSPSINDLKGVNEDKHNASPSTSPQVYGSRQGNHMREVHKRINTAASSLYSMGHQDEMGSNTQISPQPSLLISDPLNKEIEFLLKDWHQSLDILFGIHPLTGDLLVWKAEWIDEYIPGSVQQPQINFLYYIPNAFNQGDEVNGRSLCGNVTFKDNVLLFTDHSLLYENLLSLLYPKAVAPFHQLTSIHLEMESWSRSYFETFPLYLVTNTPEGNLDLWLMNYISKEYEIPRILNVEHTGQVFGHRHRINQVMSHPILPLVLSAARYRPQPSQVDCYSSEIIVWKLQPIGPLSKSGGLRELGKVTSTGTYGFRYFSWIPGILSWTRNNQTPGTAFVALNGNEIYLYEIWIPENEPAIDLNVKRGDGNYTKEPSDSSLIHHQDSDKTITAAGPALTRSSSKAKVSNTTLQGFNGKRRQSTMLRKRLALETHFRTRGGRGVINDEFKGAKIVLKQKILLSDILPNPSQTTFPNNDIKLFHVFDASIVSAKSDVSSPVSPLKTTQPDFGVKGNEVGLYYLVLLVEIAEQQGNDDVDTYDHRLYMWSMNYEQQGADERTVEGCAIQFLAEQRIDENDDSSGTDQRNDVGLFNSPILPLGVYVTTAEPATNHLSAGSLSTATPPYSICLGCSDATLRFLECIYEGNGGDAKGNPTYQWIQWAMPFAYDVATPSRPSTVTFEENSKDSVAMSDSSIEITKPSVVKLEYIPVAVACAYTGRIGCVVPHFDQPTQGFKVLVFECESSGGSSWILEDRIFIQEEPIAFADDSNDIDQPDLNSEVRMTWIQTEDGSHLLLVVTQQHLYAYTYVTFAPLIDNEYYRRYQTSAQNFLLSPAGLQLALDSDIKRRGSIMQHPVPSPANLRARDSMNAPPNSLQRDSLSNGANIDPLAIPMSTYFPQSGASAKWQLLYNLNLGHLATAFGSEVGLSSNLRPSAPRTVMCWVRDGAFVLSSDHALRIYSPWSPLKGGLEEYKGEMPLVLTRSVVEGEGRSQRDIIPQPVSDVAGLQKLGSRPHLVKWSAFSSKKPNISSKTPTDPVKDSSPHSATGIFGAAFSLSPVLPQYHPKQLAELLECGQLPRVKAILAYLTNYLSRSDRLAAVASHRSKLEHVSLQGSRDRAASIAFSSRAGERGRLGSKTGRRDSNDMSPSAFLPQNTGDIGYFKVESVPPLPMFVFLKVDALRSITSGPGLSPAAPKTWVKKFYDRSNICNLPSDDEDGRRSVSSSIASLKRGSIVKIRKYRSGKKVGTGKISNDSIEEKSSGPSSSESEDSTDLEHKAGDVVTGLDTVMSAEDLTQFGPDQIEILTRYLSRISLPGLSSLEQMHLLALADTVAWIVKLAQSPTIPANNKMAAAGSPSLSVDSAGLRYLVAMRQYNYLLACLPPKSRKILKHKGMNTASVAWAFHSRSQDKLLENIPSFQKGNYTWDEFKQHGIGWWLRDKALLQTYVEKIARFSFQTNKEPLDAAVFFMMLQKKAILLGLFRTGQNSKMVDFLKNDFSQERWKRAALKNAFALMGKQRFAEAVAFFLLGSSLKDAIEVCLKNLKDLQMALVIARLYEPSVPDLTPVHSFAPLDKEESAPAPTRKVPGSLIGFGRPGAVATPIVEEIASTTSSRPSANIPSKDPKNSPQEYKATPMEIELHRRFLATVQSSSSSQNAGINTDVMGGPTKIDFTQNTFYDEAIPRDPFLQSISLWVLGDYRAALSVFLHTLSPTSTTQRSAGGAALSRSRKSSAGIASRTPTMMPLPENKVGILKKDASDTSTQPRPTSKLSGEMGKMGFRRRLSSVTEGKEAPSSFFLQMDNIYDNTSIFNFYNFLRSHYDFQALPTATSLSRDNTENLTTNINMASSSSGTISSDQTYPVRSALDASALLRRRMTASDVLLRKGLPTRGGPYTSGMMMSSSRDASVDSQASARPRDQISPKERHLYFACAYTYLKIGCPALALEILSQLARTMPRNMHYGVKYGDRRKASTDGDDIFSQLKLIACLKIVTHELMSTFANTTFCEEEIDEYIPPINGERSSTGDETEAATRLVEGQPQGATVDSINDKDNRAIRYGNQTAARMWLRFYIWLEKEIEATTHFCGDNEESGNSDGKGVSRGGNKEMGNQKYATFLEARSAWLIQNESLLRTLYSFTCLHKPLGALAYVRMELGSLLYQTDRIKSPQTIATSNVQALNSVDTSDLPYLLAYFARPNRQTCHQLYDPVAFLRDMSYDIMTTVLDHFSGPVPPQPEPGCEWNRLLTMQDTSHALAICLFQGLGPLNPSSTNNITGRFEELQKERDLHKSIVEAVNTHKPVASTENRDGPQRGDATVLYTSASRLDQICNSDFDVILNFWWRYYYTAQSHTTSRSPTLKGRNTDSQEEVGLGYFPKLLLIQEAPVGSDRPSIKSSSPIDIAQDMDVSKWPGLNAFNGHGQAGDGLESLTKPGLGLKLFLAESLISIHASCFLTALATYDACLLYRIACLKLDAKLWCELFGYGHQEIYVPASSNDAQTSPYFLHLAVEFTRDSDSVTPHQPPGKMRPTSAPARPTYTPKMRETFRPPVQNVFARILRKPCEDMSLSTQVLDYDSEGSPGPSTSSSEDEDDQDYKNPSSTLFGPYDSGLEELRKSQHLDPHSFAWTLMRLACVRLLVVELGSFLAGVMGWSPEQLPVLSPKLHAYLLVLEAWERGLSESLSIMITNLNYPGPIALIPSLAEPDSPVDSAKDTHPSKAKDKETMDQQPTLARYKGILDPNNTPFASNSRSVLPIKRLWLRLVRDERTHDVFVRFIYKNYGASNSFTGHHDHNFEEISLAPTPISQNTRAATGLNLKAEANKLIKRASQVDMNNAGGNGGHPNGKDSDHSIFTGPVTRYSARGNPMAGQILSKNRSPIIFSILQKDREPIQCFAMKSKFIYSSSLDALSSSDQVYDYGSSPQRKFTTQGQNVTQEMAYYAEDCFFYPRTDMLALGSSKEMQEMDIHQALNCPQWVRDDTELDIYSSKRKLSRSDIEYLIVPNESMIQTNFNTGKKTGLSHLDLSVVGSGSPKAAEIHNPIPKIHLRGGKVYLSTGGHTCPRRKNEVFKFANNPFASAKNRQYAPPSATFTDTTYGSYLERAFDMTSVDNDFQYLYPKTPIRSRYLTKIILKRNEIGVRKIVSHPLQDYYLTGGQDGFIKLWKWGDHNQLAKLSTLPTKIAPYALTSAQTNFPKINGLRYSAQGSKFGAMYSDGRVSLFNSSLDSYINSQSACWNNVCHNRIGSDFTFMGCSSLICTAGLSSDNKNLCIWDTLLPERTSCIHSFVLSQDAQGGPGTGGMSAVEHAPIHNCLVATTKKGQISLIDLRMRKVRYTFQGHDSGIRCLALDPSEEYFVTGSPEGNIKVWPLSMQAPPMYTFNNEHFRTSIFRSAANQGVFQVYVDSHNRVYSCGADGTLKVRKLPEEPDDFSMESTFI